MQVGPPLVGDRRNNNMQVCTFYLLVATLLYAVAAQPPRRRCPDGSNPFQCYLEPCLNQVCRKHPEAKCVNDYCGGCYARFYLGRVEVTNDCCACVIPPVNQCQVSDRVVCVDNPCRTASCPRVPDAKCFDDYCGSCKARWFLADCSEVTRQCQRRDD